MKVGTHAKETLEDIIARKTKEIEKTGFAMWGYGGGTCHPRTIVQPFASGSERNGNVIYLCMQEMNSKHFAEPVRADEFSVDGEVWEDIPRTIDVLGSRYALVVKNLRKEALTLPLSRTRVAIGNSTGRDGSRYVQGRVDKACLEIGEDVASGPRDDEDAVSIGLVAELAKPYAVFLRNRL
jgi:hypothetical protein